MIIRKIDIVNDYKFCREAFHSLQDNYKFQLSHLQFLIKYYEGNDYVDSSFIVEKNDKIPVLLVVAFCRNQEFSFFDLGFDVFINHLASTDDKQIAFSLIKGHVRQKFNSIHFRSQPELNRLFWNAQAVTRFDHIGCINLLLDEATIFSNIRSSYKSLVNKGRRTLQTFIVDHENVEQESKRFYDFKAFHVLTAGRETRSLESWNLQLDSIAKNESFLMLGYQDGEMTCGALILLGKKEAFYGVAVNDRQRMSKNESIGHSLIFDCILRAKSLGRHLFNLGAVYSTIFNEKELQIGKFKEGFSLELRPSLVYKVSLEKNEK